MHASTFESRPLFAHRINLLGRPWRLVFAALIGCSALGLAVGPVRADTLMSQDFDVDPINYTTTPFFLETRATAGDRYYNLSNAAGISLNPGLSGATGTYIAVQDADTAGYATGNPPTLTFDNFTVGLSTNLQLSISLAGLPNAEPENYIRAQVDTAGNGTWTNLFNFQGAPGAYTNAATGQSLNGTFQTFTYPIPSPTDGVLRLRVLSYNDTDSLNEATGYDNILLTGDPVFGTVGPNISTNFSEPNLNSTSYVRGTNPPGTELGFSTTSTGTTKGVLNYNGDKQFTVAGSNATFLSEAIDLRTAGAVTAGIDLRAYNTTVSGFETTDFMNAFVQYSTDGTTFTKVDFFNANGDSVGAVDGPLDLLESGGTQGAGINGPLTHFSLSIPAEASVMRFGVNAMTDSPTIEFLIWDNLSVVIADAFFPGDADHSGTVDFTDLGILLNNYNQPGVWETGDFDNTGTVNFTDLGILLNNYNQSAPTTTISVGVPEPSSIVLAGLGLVGMMLVVRRKRA